MIKFKEFKKRCNRIDQKINDRNHWFSSKFSIYFSYVFVLIGFSANQVTLLFFLTGLLGAFLFSFSSLEMTLFGYVLYRLHIIFDMCDGDVARFNNSFSINGIYWDSMIHSVLNPLFYAFITFSFYIQFSNHIFLIICPFISLSSSILMAVKNNYFKALLLTNEALPKKLKRDEKLNLFKKTFNFFAEILSIEGFVFFSIFVKYFVSETGAIFFLFAFMFFNFTISLYKFYNLSIKGFFQNRF